MKKIIVKIALLLASFPVFAIPFENGDFSSSTGWTDFSETGSAIISGGEAILETGDGSSPFSAVLLQGDDGFFTFGSPITLDVNTKFLSFDAEFIDMGADTSEFGFGFFPDALFVSVFDADDSNLECDFFGCFDPDDILIDPFIDAFVPGVNNYQFDVSALAGHDVALSFELSDEDDGYNSKVIIDNVAFLPDPSTLPPPPTPIPNPKTIFLLGIGLIGLAYSVRKKALV